MIRGRVIEVVEEGACGSLSALAAEPGCTLQLLRSIGGSLCRCSESIYRSALIGFVRRDVPFRPSVSPRRCRRDNLLIAATLAMGGWLDPYLKTIGNQWMDNPVQISVYEAGLPVALCVTVSVAVRNP